MGFAWFPPSVDILHEELRAKAFKGLIASDMLRHREKAAYGVVEKVGNVSVV